jgi:hypothetical protein
VERTFRNSWWLDKTVKGRDALRHRSTARNRHQPFSILKAMFFVKLLMVVSAAALFLASCTPSPPVLPTAGNPATNVPGGQPAGPVPTTPQEEKLRQERIKANREAAERRAALEAEKKKAGETDNPSERTAPVEPPKRELIKPSKKLRVASPIPGKPGYVFNPWTLKPVDVRGIPSGSRIRDPNDGNPDHIFLVP